MKASLSILILSLVLIVTSCFQNIPKEVSLEDYFEAPDTVPVLFAPELFTDIENYRDICFTPDYKEFYFTLVKDSTYDIMYSKLESGKWSTPKLAPFSSSYDDYEAFITPDGKSLYFASNRPSQNKPDMTNDIDIWKVIRENNGWSQPELLDENVNTNCMEYYPSLSDNGNLYFGRNDSALTRGDIHYAKQLNGGYSEAIKLPETVNLPYTSFNAFIARDESYIIFPSYVNDSGHWHSELFVSFNLGNSRWSQAKDLGNNINTASNEISPWISYDGKYLFYSSTQTDSTGMNKNHRIYWLKNYIVN